jgi:hypothetical protein
MALLIKLRPGRAFIIALLLALDFLVAPARLLAQGSTEYELKAVMLFNLARFVEWPAKAFAETNSPIIIGVLGRNPFGDTLVEAVRGENVNGRPIVVEHYDNLQSLKPCHILFISSSERSRLDSILAKLKGRPTLSVSEIDGFTKIPGGMIRFYTNDQKKIRLRLNLESTHAEGLDVSSQLIRVADLDKVSSLWPASPESFRLALWVPNPPP